MPRRATIFERIRARYPAVVTVDAGDAPGWRPDRTRHTALFGVIRRLGYDAVGVGDGEFVDSVDFYASEIRTHALPVVNANIRVPSVADWEQLSPPYRMIHAGGLRIGVIGIASRQAFALTTPDQTAALQIDPAEEALRRFMPIVKKQADLTLVLSHAGFEANRALARRFPDIDVIVGGHSQTALHEPVMEGRTLIVHAGHNGSYVGQLNLVLDQGRRIIEYGGRLLPLTADIPDEPAVRHMLDAYQDALHRTVEQIARQPAPGAPYRGGDDCRPCHEAQYQQWQTTPHARAFKSLADHGNEDMAECLFCHTTGYGQPTGFIDTETTPTLINVQCESCHRVSQQHGQNEYETSAARIDGATCAACHTPDRSPGFHFEEAIDAVRH